MSTSTITSQFLSWARRGFAEGEPSQDFTLTATGGEQNPTTLTLRLAGPGDVLGLDPHQVLRTDPTDLATDVEPNYLAAIELADPTLPWLFTPCKPDGAGLKPWLCLIVLPRREGIALNPGHDGLPPWLSGVPVSQLPDLSEANFWAHVQVLGAATDENALDPSKGLACARLLCPRKLDSGESYDAYVVPTFEWGRLAGRGKTIDPTKVSETSPAWTDGAPPQTTVDLPVYFHWSFSTGVGGDFGSLATAFLNSLKAGLAGVRQVQVKDGWSALPLRGLFKASEESWQTLGAFQDWLKPILAGQAKDSPFPWLAPPVYGALYAQAKPTDMRPNASNPAGTGWFADLNLTPEARVAAGLARQLVDLYQEALVEDAYQQLETSKVPVLNQDIHRSRLTQAVSTHLQKRLLGKGLASSVALLSPMKDELVVSGETLSEHIRKSPVPGHVASCAFRRMASPRGKLARRLTAGTTASVSASGFVSKFNQKLMKVTAPTPPRGVKSIDGKQTPFPQAGVDSGGDDIPVVSTVPIVEVSQSLSDSNQNLRGQPIEIGGTTTNDEFDDDDVTDETAHDLSGLKFKRLRTAAHTCLTRLNALEEADSPPTADTPLDTNVFEAVKKALAALDTIRAAFGRRVRKTSGLSEDQASQIQAGAAPAGNEGLLVPQTAAPDFTEPMLLPLLAHFPEWLVQGLEALPEQGIQCLTVNARFIEAFMVGLNDALVRELLWRGYPLSASPTLFQHFWPKVSTDGSTCIDALNTWGASALGSGLTDVPGVGLLVRSPLLRRCPGLLVYARDSSAAHVFPRFQLPVDEQTRLVVFPAAVSADTLKDYSIVLEERMTASRFGLDEPSTSGKPVELKSWDKLAWDHVDVSGTDAEHIRVVSAKPNPQSLEGLTWGSNAAQLAAILRQKPFRVVVPGAWLVAQA